MGAELPYHRHLLDLNLVLVPPLDHLIPGHLAISTPFDQIGHGRFTIDVQRIFNRPTVEVQRRQAGDECRPFVAIVERVRLSQIEAQGACNPRDAAVLERVDARLKRRV